MADGNMIAVHAIISDACRQNKTANGAFLEAVLRLQREYDVLCVTWAIGQHVNLHLKLEVDFSEFKAEVPGGPNVISVPVVTDLQRAVNHIVHFRSSVDGEPLCDSTHQEYWDSFTTEPDAITCPNCREINHG